MVRNVQAFDELTRRCRVFLGRNGRRKSLLVRIFALLSTGSRDLSDRLPVLTLLTFRIQLLFNTCLDWVQERASGLPQVPGVENDEDDEDKWEEQTMDGAFVLSEVGAYLDFSDEMGRKAIVKLVREYRFQVHLFEESGH